MSICISWGRQFSAVSHVQKGKRARASSRGHRAQERSASCLHSWNSVSARGLPPNTASCIQRWALSHGGSGDSKDWWLRNTELGTDIKAWYTLQGVEKGLHGKSKRIWFFFFKWALGPKILLSMVSLLCFLCDGPLVLPWAWCFYSGFYRPDVWVPPLKFWCGRAFP